MTTNMRLNNDHTLVSFLGKGRLDPQTGYKKANYCFQDGSEYDEPFFGLALVEQLKPKRLILVGTAGSMWDVFFERNNPSSLELMTAVEENKVTQELLIEPCKKLQENLGLQVECLLIPFAQTTLEQIEVLTRLADRMDLNEKLYLDVTHGFRHLPMLAVVAARYLTHVKQVVVTELYYGALEMTENGKTPVLELSGLLRMLDWVEALSTYKKDGDYSVFAQLLEADGMVKNQTELLKKASFFERTSNTVKAKEALSSVFQDIEKHEGGLSNLFKKELMNRINWFRKNNRYEWETALAEANLQREDYLRAAIFMFESVSTRAVMDEKLGDIHNFDNRKDAYKTLASGNKNYQKLQSLRNALTHGLSPLDKREQPDLSHPKKLETTLNDLKKVLLKP